MKASQGYTISYTGPSGAASAFLTTNVGGSITIQNLCGGTYSNIVATLNGCASAAKGPITLNNPTPPSFTTATPNNTSTCGGNDGSIVLSGIVPANANYAVTYTYNGNPQTYTATATSGSLTILNLSAGSYDNFVISSYGCISNVVTGPFIISDPTKPSGTINGSGLACNGVLTGLYSVTTSGCSNCAYNWSSSNATPTNPNSSATSFTFSSTGNLTIQVQITNGVTLCSSIVSKNVNVSGVPTITGITQGSCVGFAAPILVNATVTPVAAMEFQLDSTTGVWSSSNSFASVANGAHTVYARVVGTSCVSTALNFTINCACANPANVNITGNNTTCTNSPVTLTAALITATSASWSVISGAGTITSSSCSGNGCTTQFSSASAGTNIIQLVTNDPDGVGPCDPDTALFTISVNATPTLTSATIANPSTCAGSNGSIQLNGVTPAGTYLVSYSKNSVPQTATITTVGTTLTINNLTAGTYTNFSISKSGCISSILAGPYTLVDPTPPSGTVTGPTPVCNSAITSQFYKVNGLTNCNGCTYAWSSAGGTAISANADSTLFTFNSTGNQTVQVQITSGTTNCTNTISQNVLVQGIPTVNAVSQGSCIGFAASATINASVSPNATLEYQLDGAGAWQTSTLFATVSNGSHTVKARVQGANCESNPFTFVINCSCTTPPSATINGNNTTCEYQQVILSSSLTNATSGTWSIVSGGGSLSTTVCSGNGCTTIYTPSTGILSPINAVIQFTTNDPDGVGPCSASSTQKNITVYPQPIIDSAKGSNPTSCGGCNGSFTIYGLNANQGYTVTYTGPTGSVSALISSNINGTITVTNLCTGTYSNITVTSNGCTSAAYNSVTLNNPTAPTLASNTSTNPTTCGGQDGSITFNVSPNGTYNIAYTKNGIPQVYVATATSGTVTIANLTAGTYANFTVTNYGCTSTTLAGPIVLVDPSIPNGGVAGPSPVCNGTTTTPYSVNSLTNCSTCGYAWSATGGIPTTGTFPTTTINFSGLGAQTVQVKLTNTSTLCTNTISRSIVVSGIPVVNNVSIGACSGFAAPVTVNASVTPSDTIEYAMDSTTTFQSSNVFGGIANGTHTAYVRVKHTNCTSSGFTFTVSCACLLPPAVSINGNNTTCANSPLTLIANLTNADSGNWAITTGGGSISTTHCSGNGCTTIYTPNAAITSAQNVVINFTTNDPDAAGPCVPTSYNFIITVYPVPSIGGTTFTNTTSCGTCDGTITLIGLKPSQAYTVGYIGSGGATSAVINSNSLGNVIITGLCAGTYSNITASQNGCTSTSVGPITISNPAAPTIGSDSLVNTSACGGSDGKLILMGIKPSSGNFTFTYTKNGAPQSTAGFVSAGYFEITGFIGWYLQQRCNFN